MRIGFAAAAFGAALGLAALGSAQSESLPNLPDQSATGFVEAVEIGAVEARTGALLLSGQAGGNVDGALIWSLGGRGDDKTATVPFVVEVDGASLVSGGPGRSIAIGLYAYVVDTDGKVVEHIAQGLVLDRQDFADRFTSAGLKFFGHFKLGPGDYALRVLVRNQRSGAYFMSWSLISVPTADDPAQRLLPPLFADDASNWIVAHQAGVTAQVLLADTAGVLPSARPVLTEDRPAEFWLGGGGWAEGSRIGIRVVNSVGRTVSEPLVEITGPPMGDFELRSAEISTIDLPPGNYTMIVTLSGDRNSEVLRRALPIMIVGAHQPRVWTGTVAPNDSEGDSTVGQIAAEGKRVKKREVRASYRRALQRLAAGDEDAARRGVAELERTVERNPSRKALHELGEAEYAESKELASTDPNALIPLALLHRELYQGYMARNEGPLAFHARKMALAYAEQLARLDPENGFSEALMVNLAADLAQAGAASAARGILEETVRINPTYRPALLSLGFSFERNGEYFEASVFYRRLVESSPDFHEGQLRLALNLIRIGRSGAGVELLKGLLQADVTPWVKAVAAHELVRYLIADKSLVEAERAARNALAQMPDDQRLWILLGAILERLDRHGEAIQAVTNLPPAGRGVSPRARYAEWPSLGFNASQASLAAQAEVASPALKHALDASGKAE